MKNFWNVLGGKLGVGLCGLGLLLVFLGWNGAASVDRVPSQFPYLISGGIAGLCLVVCGVGLLIIQNQRADRAELQATLRELRDALGAHEVEEPFELPPRRPTPTAKGAGRPSAPVPAIEVIDDDQPTEAAASKRRRRPRLSADRTPSDT